MGEPISADRVLSDKLITVVKRDDRQRLYCLKFGILSQIVTFGIVRLDDQLFDCDQSHYLCTTRHGHAKSAHTRDVSADQALYKAVHRIIFDYGLAVRNGEEPCQEWLRPNEYFGEMSAAYLSNTKAQRYWNKTGRHRGRL